MSKVRRSRSLGPLLLGVGLVLACAIAVVWTWPASWTAPDEPAAEAPRVGPERRPQWVRRAPALPRVPTGVAVPPASRMVQTDEESPEIQGAESGPAWITGWLVDSRGTNVGGGRLRARCQAVDSLTGDVLAPEGVRPAATDGSGWFEMGVTGPARCMVFGERADGLLIARSEPIELWIEPGEELEIDVVVPAARTGGIGVQFREHPDGMLVERVHEGTPAFEAGLRRGDVIVEVDGQPASELDQDGFIANMTGPEGSEVRFVARFKEDGELVEEPYVVRRRFLDRQLIR